MAQTSLEALVSDEEFYAKEFTERPAEVVFPEHGVNPLLPSVARQLWHKGYSDQEIFNLIRRATRVIKHRRITDGEIKRSIALVIGTPIDSLKCNHVSSKNLVYDPEVLRERAERISEAVDEAWLEARSQFTCWNRTPTGVLHKLYRPGEHVWTTTNAKSGLGKIWTHHGHDQRFDELDCLATGCNGVWFLANPISGELFSIERCKSDRNPEGLTFTTIECITSWRYGLIESDEAPRDLWLKAIVQIRLPIVAIYDSGKRSIHCLVRFDATSKEHLDNLLAKYKPGLVTLGADPGSLNSRRISRLPNCVRGETGQLQRLLYLRPSATDTPICQIPPREPPGAIEARIRATHAGVLHNYESPIYERPRQ